MKPIIAIASMVLGSASMATVVYLASNPKALLSPSTPIYRYTDVPVQVPNPSRMEVAEAPRMIQVSPLQVKVRHTPRIQTANLKPSSEEPMLTACSDWRPLGPSSTESGVGSGEHQVKLLCPTGANAQDTFMADVQLHPTKMRLNDWSQLRPE